MDVPAELVNLARFPAAIVPEGLTDPPPANVFQVGIPFGPADSRTCPLVPEDPFNHRPLDIRTSPLACRILTVVLEAANVLMFGWLADAVKVIAVVPDPVLSPETVID